MRDQPNDDSDLEKQISDRLNAMGFQSTFGTDEQPPEPVDAIVIYQDRWMWDITMYMLELTVEVRDPESDYVLASGHSYRTSLARKPPEFMVAEVLEEIFAGAPKAP